MLWKNICKKRKIVSVRYGTIWCNVMSNKIRIKDTYKKNLSSSCKLINSDFYTEHQKLKILLCNQACILIQRPF